ncbi:MAG: GerMN domain-containing protein [Suilimivivens sp.]
MVKKGKLHMLLMLCLFLLLLTACGRKKEETAEYAYKIYYVNYDNTGVIFQEYTTESADTETVLSELLEQLGTVPGKLEYHAPLAGSFSLLDYSLTDGQLLLNFDGNYKNQEIITEILNRAAIVRTLTQLKEISYVSFLINSDPLTDASGNVVGVMNGETFIDNAGNEINTYEKVKLHLYFANEAGTGLTSVNRTKVYNSNISLERLIVEEIIAGPKENDTGVTNGSKAYPVINPDTKVVSVTVRDGICYVNLDNNFVNQIYNVTPEVTIYALTNSLVELSNVNKVQISINGETNINYRENINLSALFERNLDLVD